MSSLDYTYENLEKVVPRHFFGQRNMLIDGALDPRKTMVLALDIQKLIVSPNGAGHVPSVGGAPAGTDTVQPCIDVVEASRKAGIPVVWSLWGLRGDGRDTGNAGPKWPPFQCGTPQSPGSWGNKDAELDDRVKPRADEIVFQKHRFSSFYNTALDEWMREDGRDTLVICGVTSANCMLATSLDGWNKNYKIVALADTTTAVPNMLENVPLGYGQHWEALRNIQMNYGDVRTSHEYYEMIGQKPSAMAAR